MQPWLVAVPLHADPANQPPPFTLWTLLTQWTFDPVIVIGLLATVALYLWGVWRLHRRGDHWPAGRTVAWCLGGMGTIAIATLSALGAYDTVLFSVHMVQHTILALISPVLLALGAPFTLLIRNTTGRPRAVVVRVMHSWVSKVAFFPPLAMAFLVLTPFILYLTPLYEMTMRDDVLHNLLHMEFIITGCLLFWPLLGIDPMPNRLPYPLRILMFLITMPFHAFLGVTIMGSTTLIAEEWYVSFGRAWPPSPMEDQTIAGGIMWGTGDFVMIIIMSVFFVQWLRESQAEARREDRRLDRLEAEEAALQQAPIDESDAHPSSAHGDRIESGAHQRAEADSAPAASATGPSRVDPGTTAQE